MSPLTLAPDAQPVWAGAVSCALPRTARHGRRSPRACGGTGHAPRSPRRVCSTEKPSLSPCTSKPPVRSGAMLEASTRYISGDNTGHPHADTILRAIEAQGSLGRYQRLRSVIPQRVGGSAAQAKAMLDSGGAGRSVRRPMRAGGRQSTRGAP